MFLSVPKVIPPWMRPTYLAASVLLGLVVSYGLHAVIELWYLSYAESHNLTITWTQHLGLGSCALPLWVQYGLPVLGIVGGYLQGRVWWRWIYVERRWQKG